MSHITKLDNSKVRAFDSVDMTGVKLQDSLLERRRSVNHGTSLSYQYDECERTGRIDNFRIAAGLKEGKPSNRISCDADVYKWIEAVAYDVATAPPVRGESKS